MSIYHHYRLHAAAVVALAEHLARDVCEKEKKMHEWTAVWKPFHINGCIDPLFCQVAIEDGVVGFEQF